MSGQQKDDPISLDLYELMPAFYRIRDAQQGYPLRALLDVISREVDVVKRDIDGLWDDLFIETCREWVIPYIGDLVANNPLHNVDGIRRADVARTIYYRRRKGTLPMLDELARDVTGWSAHAVAFFDLLAWTQNMNHLRRYPTPGKYRRMPGIVDRVGTAHVRDPDAMDRVGGPFDGSSHTLDVRPMSQADGWYDIPHVGFFLWRLGNYPLTGVTARRAATPNTYGFHFSPLGNPAPLFHQPQRETDQTGLSAEIHVAGPIRPIAFHEHLEDYYGPDKSLAIYYRDAGATDVKLVPLEEILCKRLDDRDDGPGEWPRPPGDDPGTTEENERKVAVDVRLGRVTFPADRPAPAEVTVYYNFGFSGDIGGGPYDRRESLTRPDVETWSTTVGKSGDEDFTSLTAALQHWASPGGVNKGRGQITIVDNATYDETIGIAPGEESRLVIQADDGVRPHLKLADTLVVDGDSHNAALTLSGLLVEGRIELRGRLGEFRLLHSTLVPGGSLTEDGEPVDPRGASLTAAGTNTSLEIEIDACIVGALRLPTEMTLLTVRDSIIDGLDVPALAQTRESLGARIMAYKNHAVYTTGPRGHTLHYWGHFVPGRPAYEYSFDLSDEFVYVLPFSDQQIKQGLLVSLTADGVPVATDGSGWEVTPLSQRNLEWAVIENAVAGADAHDRWFSPTMGGKNDGTFLWDPIEGIPPEAPWMWYDSGLSGDSGAPFSPGFDHGEVLIFRHKLDFYQPGPPTVLERTTVFGEVQVKELRLASEVIFVDPVRAQRTQEGCVRFSYLPDRQSRTPRRHRCQPDLALTDITCELKKDLIRARLKPAFTTRTYGHPAYGQLSLCCPEEIRTGAESAAEMGAFEQLQQPQRIANLQLRLREYLPFGREAGLIFVT